MAKTEVESFWSGLFAAGLYKRSQGRLARQLTAAALGLFGLIGAYILSQGPLVGYSRGISQGVPALIVFVVGWISFRLVNYPPVAEFLISVEGEMSKVSWPGKTELYRATVVVLSTMLFLAVVLYVYDRVWLFVLSSIGILKI